MAANVLVDVDPRICSPPITKRKRLSALEERECGERGLDRRTPLQMGLAAVQQGTGADAHRQFRECERHPSLPKAYSLILRS
jgi:hypothetical protein